MDGRKNERSYVISVLIGGKLKDTSWIKPQLKELFAGKYDWFGFNRLYKEKLDRFNGKLYKYYSFSKDDSNHSLDNFKNDIIYFSKPEIFNDPFDCMMGISIDDLAHSFLMPLINKSIGENEENSEVIKQSLEGLLFEGKEITTDDPTIKLLKLLIKSPAFFEVIQKAKNKEQPSQQEMMSAIMCAFAEPDFAKEFFSLISNPEGSIDLGQAMQGGKIAALIQPILSNEKLLGLFCEDSPEALSGISAIKSQKGILKKMSAVAEMSGQDSTQLKEETKKIEESLSKEIEKLKQKINEIIGVTCFAERPDNVLMWSHYANKHTGFCVEYDFSKLKSIEAKSMLFPVIYSKNRAVLPLGLFDFSDIKNVKLVENSLPIPEIVEALLIKSEVWQYEEEWRIICFLKNFNEQKLVENMISKVYLGANINEENERLISELAKAKEVPVEKFKISPETFELKIQIDG